MGLNVSYSVEYLRKNGGALLLTTSIGYVLVSLLTLFVTWKARKLLSDWGNEIMGISNTGEENSIAQKSNQQLNEQTDKLPKD